jgi:transposase-like protein
MAKSIVTCNCGTSYERTEKKGLRRSKGSFNCRVCGKELDSWSGFRKRSFRILKRLDADTD